jgi:hypothetical protein
VFRHFKFVIIISLISGGFFSFYADGVQFSKENIAVTVLTPSMIEIRGEYFFTSQDTNTAFSNLFYPFPVDSSSLYPCFINVKKIRGADTLPFTRNDRGIFFPVDVHAKDTTEIEIIYRQQVKNHSGTYILTTTSAWGNPLHNSTYSVSIPQTLNLDYMSYECDSVQMSGSNIIYGFSKKQFMPDRDLFFRWSVK